MLLSYGLRDRTHRRRKACSGGFWERAGGRLVGQQVGRGSAQGTGSPQPPHWASKCCSLTAVVTDARGGHMWPSSTSASLVPPPVTSSTQATSCHTDILWCRADYPVSQCTHVIGRPRPGRLQTTETTVPFQGTWECEGAETTPLWPLWEPSLPPPASSGSCCRT